MIGWIRRFGCFTAGVGRRFLEDHCQTNASALAFATLLAVVPLAAVVFSSLSMFPVFEQWAAAVEEFVYQNFVPAAGAVVREHLQRFAGQTGRLTVFGLVFLLLSALMLLYTIEDTFNRIWRIHRGRALIQRVLAYWAVLTLGPLLMGASLSLSSYLISLAVASEARSRFLEMLPFVFEVLAFVLLYTVVPNCVVRLRHAAVGGAVAAVLFEFSKRGFALFVLNFSSYEVVYGALATIPIFLIWIYLSWLLILFGAEVTAALSTTPGSQPTGAANRD